MWMVSLLSHISMGISLIAGGEDDLSSLNELLVLNGYSQITINLRCLKMVFVIN